MTQEARDIIEGDAARAPAPIVLHDIALVPSSIPEARLEIAEHATALRHKLEYLEYLERSQRVDAAPPGTATAQALPQAA